MAMISLKGVDLREIQKVLEEGCSEKARDWIQIELPRGEEIFKHSGPGNPAYHHLIRELTRLYSILNAQLGLICQEIKFPLHQSEWDSQKPLEVMRKFWPHIPATNWYQYQMGQMLVEQDHPWMSLTTTYVYGTPSDLPDIAATPLTEELERLSIERRREELVV